MRTNFRFLLMVGLTLLAVWWLSGGDVLVMGLVLGGVGLLVLFFVARETPHYFMARYYLNRGDDHAAKQAADKLVSARPKKWGSYLLRSVILARLGEGVTAEADARHVLAFSPNRAAGHNALGNALFAQARFGEALDAFESALTHQPKTPLMQYNRALALYRLQRYDAAIEALTEVLLKPLPTRGQNLLANYYLGRSYQAQGKRSAAEAAFSDMYAHRGALAALQKEYAALPNSVLVVLMRQDLQQIASLVS